jgi:DNA-binding PadR family transcriptional regulator
MTDIDSFLPLSTPVLHVLLALGAERRHGLGIIESIQRKTEGRARILPGTLYVTLNRMADDGLIEEVDRPDGADARRRYWAATELGQGVLAAETERMAVLLRVARDEGLEVG